MEGYLTEWAQRFTNDQWNLSRKCKVIKCSDNMHLVYVPTEKKKLNKGEYINIYSLLRYIFVYNFTNYFIRSTNSFIL